MHITEMPENILETAVKLLILIFWRTVIPYIAMAMANILCARIVHIQSICVYDTFFF